MKVFTICDTIPDLQSCGNFLIALECHLTLLFTARLQDETLEIFLLLRNIMISMS